ncbi:PAS domain S-box protein [candidate division KSB1 bacterium]|nr:PAS domain S-box protein [candidate division KSB1 bacterium]
MEKTSTDLLTYLNRLIVAIQQINKELLGEATPSALLSATCNHLIDQSVCDNAWILLNNESTQASFVFSSGFNAEFDALSEQLGRGQIPNYFSEALLRPGIVFIPTSAIVEEGAPFTKCYVGKSAVSVSLNHNDQIFGLMTLGASSDFISNQNVLSHINNLADNLGMALFKLRMRKSGIDNYDHSDQPEGLHNTGSDHAAQLLTYFRSAVESSSDAIGMSTPDGKHWYQNSAFDNLFGKIGDDPPATVYVDEAIGRKIFQSIIAGHSWNGEVEMYDRYKNILNILLRAYPIKDKSNKLIGLVGVHTDITDQKRREQQFRDTMQILDDSQANAHIGTWWISLPNLEIGWTDEVYRLFGFDIDDGTPTFERIFAVIHPDDLSFVKTKVSEQMQKFDTPMIFEYRIILPDETIRYVQHTSKQIRNGNNDIVKIIGTLQDISVAKLAEKELQLAYFRLSTIFENTDEYIMIADENRKPVMYNSGYARMMKELLNIDMKPGINPHKSINDTATQAWWDSLHERVLSGEKFQVEFPYEATPGNIRHFEIHYFPVIENDQIKGFTEYTREITNRKQAESLIRENEYFLKESQRVGNIGSYLFDIHKGVWSSSEELDDIFGIDDSFDRSVQGWIQIIHSDDRETMQDYLLSHVIRERNLFDKEYRIINYKTGEETWVHGLGELRYDGDNRPIEMIGTIQDITARKRAEAQLHITQFGIDNAQISIFQINDDGDIYYANNYACSNLGYSLNELLQLKIWEIDPTLQPEIWKVHRLRTRDSKVTTIETIHRRKNGTQFPVEVNINFIEYEGRRLSFSFATDISERREAEKQILKLNKELEQRVIRRTSQLEAANKELKNFAYIVSHDLKAPLRAVSQISNWLSTDYSNLLDNSGKEMLNLLIGRVQRMDRLIDGILEYSRIGRTHEEPVSVNLNKIIDEAIELISPPDYIHITVECELPTIIGDHTRFVQLFENLLSNAVKFMDKPEGFVSIRCQDAGKMWKLSITDNGPGIDKQHFKRIFKIFQTLHARDEIESTGIGLTVVNKIVELYGGEIWVESEIGKGSTFFITLPKRT